MKGICFAYNMFQNDLKFTATSHIQSKHADLKAFSETRNCCLTDLSQILGAISYLYAAAVMKMNSQMFSYAFDMKMGPIVRL